MTHATDRAQETTAGDAAPTSVANPRRVRLGADGRPLTQPNVRRTARD
jgi:hypothetical protein